VIVRELELDLDAFEGPFDLLLTLVLKDELELREIDVAGIVLAFLERLAAREQLDLEACGEFLVLIAALLELKARGLFPEEAAEPAELEPEAAAEELARRLAEYRRMKEAAGWLRERLESEGERFFRLGPAPLAPKLETPLAPQQPEKLAQVLRLLAVEPPQVSLAHMALRFPPVTQFLERFRAVLRRRSRFDFDREVAELSRVEQAVAFLALLELRRSGEIEIDQAAPFAPIRVARSEAGSVGGKAADARPENRVAFGAPRAGSVGGRAVDARPKNRVAFGAPGAGSHAAARLAPRLRPERRPLRRRTRRGCRVARAARGAAVRHPATGCARGDRLHRRGRDARGPARQRGARRHAGSGVAARPARRPRGSSRRVGTGGTP